MVDIVGLLHILSQNSLIAWAYVLVFFAIFIESIPLIGILIPGGTLAVIVAGVFARLGIFSVSLAICVSAIAALLVDNVGYVTGRELGKKTFIRFEQKIPLVKPLIAKVCSLMHNHTGKAIIIGRLNSPTRALAPFIAGMQNVSYVRFLFFSSISVVTWVAIFFTVGFLFGKSIESVHTIERLFLWGIILLILASYLAYLCRSYYLKRSERRRNGINHQR